MNFVLTVGLVWLFLPVVSWEMISLLADKPSPKPGENVTISATVKEQCTIIWMNNATDSVLAVCDAANCTPYATSRYRFCYQGVNITNFDWSEDGFVWNAQCGYATATYIFSKPSPADTKNGQYDEPKTVVVVTVVVVGVIAVIAVAGCLVYRKRRNDHMNKINEDHHEVHHADFHEVHHEDHHEDYDDDHMQM